MIINEQHNTMLNSPVRKMEGRVEIYEGSTLVLTCGCHETLKNYTVERVGEEGKFFGFGICQKLNARLIDQERVINPTTANYLEVVFGVDSDYLYPCPRFHVTEVNRDEETNELSITAYDDLLVATAYTVEDLDIFAPYTLEGFVAGCAALLGLPYNLDNVPEGTFDLLFEDGSNFNGDETIREALNAVAEVTQTIYYVNNDWELTFKRLDRDGEAKILLDKDKYFTLNSRTNRRLTNITHVTELGDNLTASTGEIGSTQYIRNNPFWTLRDDIPELLDKSVADIGGLTINQFDCEWRGNYLLEIGDKIDMVTKDDQTVTSYLLNDTLFFDGSVAQHSEWSYANNEAETEASPTNLGTALSQTFAKVDKINRQIELVASEVTANGEAIASLQVNTDNINSTVTNTQNNVEVEIDGVLQEIESIRNEVSMKTTSEDVKITISEELSNGVDKITTSTGFTFDEVGLTIEKSGSEMTTQITEDGMTVYRSGDAVLVANNEGVIAEDLHATTYLIVGNNSRFEDYGDSRTGCFWIGG